MSQTSPLTLYRGQEEHSPQAWEEQYVDVWLLLEITEEDEVGEPVQAKLVATTSDPMTEAFQKLWQSYADRGVPTLFTHSHMWLPMPHEWAPFCPSWQ